MKKCFLLLIFLVSLVLLGCQPVPTPTGPTPQSTSGGTTSSGNQGAGGTSTPGTTGSGAQGTGGSGASSSQGASGADEDPLAVNSRTLIYIGESSEQIESVTYKVKSYAEVNPDEPYFYIYYKYYYLNNKLRRTYVFYHETGLSDLDYKYTEFIEHQCGTRSNTILITDYSESGKIIRKYLDSGSGTKAITKFDEQGYKKEYISYSNDKVTLKQKYYQNGSSKFTANYNGGKMTAATYNSDGLIGAIITKYAAQSGQINNVIINYLSGYTRYWYCNGVLYLFEDGVTNDNVLHETMCSSQEPYSEEQIETLMEAVWEELE